MHVRVSRREHHMRALGRARARGIMFSGCPSVHFMYAFLCMWYLKNTLRDFLLTLHHCPLWLIDERLHFGGYRTLWPCTSWKFSTVRCLATVKGELERTTCSLPSQTGSCIINSVKSFCWSASYYYIIELRVLFVSFPKMPNKIWRPTVPKKISQPHCFFANIHVHIGPTKNGVTQEAHDSPPSFIMWPPHT